MKKCLPLLGTALMLAVGAPASAQYMYIDVNGDGLNTTADVLTSYTTQVDIYLATDKSLSNPNDMDSPLVAATCETGPYPLNINSYTMILNAPLGGVTYGAWTDNMGFPTDLGNAKGGNDDWIGWGGSAYTAPGTYKLGTLAVTVTTYAALLTFATSTTLNDTAITSFGSQCIGADFDNTMKYGLDWFSVGPTRFVDPVTETTWGKIKALYR